LNNYGVGTIGQQKFIKARIIGIRKILGSFNE